MPRSHWLLKSEPDVFGWDHLVAAPNQTTPWDGVRNYQARNLLRDRIQVGDLAFFYHSRAEPPHVVGIVEVSRGAYPDPSQFDPKSKYFDEGSDPDDPRWFVVEVRAVRKLARPVSIAELKATPGLEGMMVTKKGSRLSVQPVSEAEWAIVNALAEGAPASAPVGPPSPAEAKGTSRGTARPSRRPPTA